jgi:ATP/maltotriose-dependent transcriptional regulator MalT
MTSVSDTAESGGGEPLVASEGLSDGCPPRRVAWLSLDRRTEPVEFWTFVVAALRRECVDLPAELRCPSEPGSLFLGFLEELAAAVRAGDDSVLLVLDPSDGVTDPRVLRQLGLLLRKTGPALRLVVTSGRSPSTGLARRRSHGAV